MSSAMISSLAQESTASHEAILEPKLIGDVSGRSTFRPISAATGGARYR